jgi:hypothetical protein
MKWTSSSSPPAPVGLRGVATFGPVVAFGCGGTAVEVVNDKALALPPLDLKLARELIGRTRISKLLAGYRDVPAADVAAVALVLVKVAQLAADVAEIRDLDINPLLADQDGIIAVDARIAVAPVERPAATHPRLAIRPYPKEWERIRARRGHSRDRRSGLAGQRHDAGDVRRARLSFGAGYGRPRHCRGVAGAEMPLRRPARVSRLGDSSRSCA